MKSPEGVVLVFADEAGRVIANAVDFNKNGYGGFTLRESQALRAHAALAMKVCQAYSSDQLVRAIEPHQASQIVRRLIDQHGCRVHEINVKADVSKAKS